jgi:hypothetical protein
MLSTVLVLCEGSFWTGSRAYNELLVVCILLTRLCVGSCAVSVMLCHSVQDMWSMVSVLCEGSLKLTGWQLSVLSDSGLLLKLSLSRRVCEVSGLRGRWTVCGFLRNIAYAVSLCLRHVVNGVGIVRMLPYGLVTDCLVH